jgi:hypothetical protein
MNIITSEEPINLTVKKTIFHKKSCMGAHMFFEGAMDGPRLQIAAKG